MDSVEDRLDGNAAAGLLEQLFAFETTMARAVCAGCEHEYHIAELTVYAIEMGAILRCPGCSSPMLRVSTLGTECWIDATGLTVLRVRMAGEPSDEAAAVAD